MLSWADVDVFPIAPLTIAAAEDLITRLEFNEKVKGNFTKLLRKDLFRTHYEFVSVPLLCTIMLLTYSDSGYISKNRHEFFEDAFTALWSKHDGRKDDFERHRYTGLQKNEFSKILTAFAMSSYSSADYNMRESHFHRHFEAAIRLSGVSCKEEDFLQDLTISTSLAVQDGPYIRFCHRAFQEYFSALFICEVNDAIVGRLTEEILDRLETDNVLSFVLSINDEKIEKNWILPSVSMISDFVEASDRDLDGYARVIIEGDDEISRTMYKIRVLYQFDPPFQLLASAYDAARDMRIPVSRVVGLGEKPNLFQRDRRNFVYWTERLISKYERRSSALDELIDRTQLEAKTETES